MSHDGLAYMNQIFYSKWYKLCELSLYSLAPFSFFFFFYATRQDLLLFFRMLLFLWLLSNLYVKHVQGNSEWLFVKNIFRSKLRGLEKEHTWIQSQACPNYKLISVIQHRLDTHWFKQARFQYTCWWWYCVGSECLLNYRIV